MATVALAGLRGEAQEATPPAATATNSAPAAAAAPVAEAGEPRRDIRFQFDGMPYMDVVRRFSQMVNKPLLTTTNLEGTVTFNDPRPYTYQEAFDTLNTILSMKNVMLVEVDRYLQVVPFSQLPQMPLRIFRGLSATGDASPGEVVTVLLELKNLDASEAAKSIASMLSNAGSVAPLSRGKGLILTDRLSSIQRIKQLLSEVDSSSPVAKSMKTYTLVNASGAVVSDLINKTFGQATAPRRTIWNEPKKSFDMLPPDPEDYVTAVFDDASKTLVLYGPAERVALAEDLIKRFEDKDGGRGGEIKIYFPRATAATELARMIRQAIPGVAAENESPTAVATKARVIVDSAMNRLIVTAPIAGQLDAIENLINKVEKGSGADSGGVASESVQVTRVFRLLSADPAAVQRALTNAFPRRGFQGERVSSLRITTDDAARTVVVTGSPGEVQHAESLVRELDRARPDVGPMETRFLEFSTANELRRLQPLIQQLYTNQVSDPSTPGSAHASFLPDPDGKRLVVSASAAHQAIVEKIARELRQPALAAQPREFKALALKNTRVDQVFKTVSELVAERMGDEMFREVPKPLLLADSANNRILATANASQMEKIGEVVSLIDVAAAAPQREFARIELRRLTYPQMAPTLNQLLRPLLESQPDPKAQPEIIPDADGKQLFVTGSAGDLAKIKQWVEEIDAGKSGGAARLFRTMRLNRRTVAEVLPLLEQLYREQLKGQPEPVGGVATFVPEAKANQLIVVGPEAELSRVEMILMQLDPPAGVGAEAGGRAFRAAQLNRRTTAEVVPLLEQLYREQLKGQPEPLGGAATFMPEAKANRIILVGPEAELARAEAILAQLDPPNGVAGGVDAREFRTAVLRRRTVAEVLPLLEQLYREQTQGKPDPAGGLATFVADSKGNRLIVSGPASELARAEAILAQLDPPSGVAGSPEPREFRSAKMNRRTAAEVLPLLEQLYREQTQGKPEPAGGVATFVADPKGNRLILSGPGSELARAEAILAQLDPHVDKPAKEETRVLRLRSAQAQELAGLVEKSLNLEEERVRILVDARSNSLVVTGGSEGVAAAAAIVEQLDSNPGLQPRELRVIDLKSGDAARIAPLAQELFTENIKSQRGANYATTTRILADPAGNRIIVTGPAEEIVLAGSLVERFDKAPEQGDTSRVFALAKANAAEVARIVNETMVTFDPYGRPVKRISATADEKSNSVVVSGTRQDLQAIATIVEKLDGDSGETPRVVRVVELKTGEPSQLVALASQIWSAQNPGRNAAKEVSLTLDPSGRRVVIVAPASVATQVEAVVTALDQEPSAEERSLHVFQITRREPSQILPVVRSLYEEKQRGSRSRPASISIDAEARKLLVFGTGEQAELVGTILEALLSDENPDPRVTRAFELRSQENANRVMPMLRQLYQDRAQNLEGKSPADAQFILDPKTARLIVSARESHLELVDEILGELGTEAAADERVTEMFEVGQPEDVRQMVPLVQQLYQDQFKGRGAEDPADAQILADERGGRVIVTGRQAHVSGISAILTRLIATKIAPKERQTKVFNLNTTMAADLVATIRQLYLEELKRFPNITTPSALILPDTVANRLIVSGPMEELEIIEPLVTKLDNVSPQTANTRVFQIVSADVTQLATILSTSLVTLERGSGRTTPRVSVGADPQSNSLVVSGEVRDLNAAATIIEQLDQGARKEPRKIRVIALQSGKAADTAAKLRQLYLDQVKTMRQSGPADALILPDAVSDRLIITATSEHLELLEGLVAELDKLAGDTARQVRILQMKKNTPSALQALISQMFALEMAAEPGQRLALFPLADSRTLVAEAPKPVMDRVQKLVDQIEEVALAADDRASRMFEIGIQDLQRVLSLVRPLYESELKGVSPNEAPDLVLVPDSATGRLFATGKSSHLEILAKAVAKVHGDGPLAGRETRIFSIGSAEEVQRQLSLTQQLYQEQLKGLEASEPANAQFIPDPLAGRIIVTASVAHLDRVAAILEKLRGSGGGVGERETRIFDLTSATAAELAETVTLLFTQELKKKPGVVSDRALILPDPLANRLIVSGPKDQVQDLEGIIRQLDKVSVQTGGARVFRLKLAEPDQVATILSTALVRWERGGGRGAPRISIGIDTKNRTLVISGDARDLSAAASIIDQLDNGAELVDRQMRVVPTRPGLAPDLATKMKLLYQDQMKSKPDLGQADALFLGDSASDRLIITAAVTQMPVIEAVLKTLEAGQTETSRELRVISLKRNSAASVGAIVSQLFAREVANTNPDLKLTVSPAPDDRTLVAEGPAASLARLQELVASLDVAREEGFQLRSYSLADSRAIELAPALTRLFAERNPGLTGAQPRFEADAASNILLVGAPREQFEQIGKLIEELKAGVSISNEIMTFKLVNSEAEQVATVLTSILGVEQIPSWARFRFGGAPRTDPKEIRIAPAPAVNSIVVQGPPQALRTAEQVIRNLDGAEGQRNAVIQTVQLKKATPEAVAEAVNKALAARGPKTSGLRATVTPVASSNSVLIDGPAEAVGDVIKIIRELDDESTGGDVEIRIYKLENGRARELSQLLNQMLQGVLRESLRAARGRGEGDGGRRREANVSIAADERGNSLIISAARDQFKVIEQLLVTLDQSRQATDKAVQFVWLKRARALDVADRLELLFAGRARDERPIIEADVASNSISIIGKQDDIREIEAIVAQLDGAAKETAVQVRMIVVENTPVDQMAEMVVSLYTQLGGESVSRVEKLPRPPAPSASGVSTNRVEAPGGAEGEEKREIFLAVDRLSNTLLLSGPAEELSQLAKLVDDLTWAKLGNDSEFRMFPLKEADPVAVARVLNDLFKPEPTRNPQPRQGEPPVIVPSARMVVVAETRSRSLIARGKATDFILLESLLQKLDVRGETAQMVYRSIPVRHLDPLRLSPLVDRVVRQMAESRPGELLMVVPDPRGGAFFVGAREVVVKELEELLLSLDTAPAFAEAEVSLVSLRNTAAPQMATILQGMLRPSSTGEVTPEALELQHQVRSLRVRDEHNREVLLDLSKPIKIMPDTAPGATRGGNRLILSSTPDNVRALVALVEMMDTVAVTEGVTFRVAPLKNADATHVAQTLTTIFQQAARFTQGPAGVAQPEGETGKALATPVNVAVDPRGNRVILSGRPESVALAMRLIEDLDGEFSGMTTTIRIVKLQYASAIRLAPMLQAVFAEGPGVPGSEGLNTQVTRLKTALEGEDPKLALLPKGRVALSIQPDAVANTLIVAAREDVLPLIEEIIKGMDIPAATGMELVRFYPLEHADPTRVSVIINELYAARAGQLRPEERAGLATDPRTNALIVTGNEKVFQFVEGLIAQLDQPIEIELGDFRTLPLKHADAPAVAATLQQLMTARAQQKAALGITRPETLRVLIVPDVRSNSIIVNGSNDSFEIVQSLAQQLDSAEPALAGQAQILPLRAASAATLATTLNAFFAQRLQAFRTADAQRNRPIILADTRMNSLIVAAGVEDAKILAGLLEKLDKKPENPALEMAVLHLRHNDSARIQDVVTRFFASRLQGMTPSGTTPEPSERLAAESDPVSNSLIVSANKENMELLKGLLEKIDREPEVEGGVIQIFTLAKADAQRVSTMLRSLVQQGLYRPGASGSRATQRTREALAIAVDGKANALIVSASPENMQVVREVIQQLDNAAYSVGGDIRMFSLKHARASQLSSTLEQFFRAKRVGETQIDSTDRTLPVTVVADDRTNTLLITGDKEAFAAVERMLGHLDVQEVFDKTNFKVFALKNSTAAKLQSTLQRLFQNRPARFVGRPSEPINIVADSWANALLVGASNEDMAMVSSLIETLDAQPTDGAIQVRVMPLSKADARAVAQTVQGLYRESPGASSTVGVNVDERINALVVSAGESDMQRIQELVGKLDTEVVARVAELRIFPLKFAQADELAQILTTALTGRADSAASESPNRQSMIQFITRTPEGGQLVSSALRESLLIVSDRRKNALVVSAPIESMNLLSRLIASLDGDAPQNAKIKMFTLVNADARQMSDLLISMFRLRQLPGQAANTRAIQYVLEHPGGAPGGVSATIGSAEQHALTVTVDPRTNSLLIGGSDEYVKLASEIIQELDVLKAVERRSVVYRLKNAQAAEIQTALRGFLDQSRTQITDTLGDAGVGTAQRILELEVAIVAEPVSNSLLLSASPQYFEQFSTLIEELDQPTPQVLIQVILAEVTLDKAMDLGVEWSVTARKGSNTIKTGTDFGVPADLSKFGGLSSSVSGNDVGFLLRALQNDGRLEVLSRPQILTADNKQATIDIGQRVPLVTDSRVTERGDSITSIEYQNVGVSLTVTPRISPDGSVKMDVEPNLSQISSSNIDIAPGVKSPIINQRKATTTVTVQSGQSIIIGGLISTTDDERTKKVPILGSIPYLGALFRSSRNLQERKELLIILTPQVLSTGDSARNMTTDQFMRSTIKDKLNRDSLQRQILDPVLPFLQGGGTNASPVESTPVRIQ